MLALIDWLMRDEQQELYEFVFALTLNILFLSLIALLFWPLGRVGLVFRLAKGYGVFWLALYGTALIVVLFRRIFRVDMYSHADAYVISALIVSSILQAGWSAFAALAVHSFVLDAPGWLTIIVYFVGALSCYIAYMIVASFYTGHIYKLINFPLALVSFILFCLWRGGRMLYGWFLNRF